MKTLGGILFDYGHTLVWLPRYEWAHLAAARSVQRVLRDLGVSVKVSRVQTLIESYVPRPNGTSFSAKEEAKGILASADVRNFSREDLQRIIDDDWRPYIENATVANGPRFALKEQMVNTAWGSTLTSVIAEGTSRSVPYRYFTGS